jgi:hypothetical protein
MSDQELTDMNWNHIGTGRPKGKGPMQKALRDGIHNRQTDDFDKLRSPTYSAFRFAPGGPPAMSQHTSSSSVSCLFRGKNGRTSAVGQNAVSSSPSHSSHGGVQVMDQSDPSRSQPRSHRKEYPAASQGATSHSQSHFDRSRKHSAMGQRDTSPSRHPIPRAPPAASRGNPALSPPHSDRENPPTTGQSNVGREQRRPWRPWSCDDTCGTRADPRSLNQANRRASDQVPKATDHGPSVTDQAPQATNQVPQATVQEAATANQESPATDQVPQATDRAVPAPSPPHPSPPCEQRRKRKKRPATGHCAFACKHKCPWFHFHCGTKCSQRGQDQKNRRAANGDRQTAGHPQQDGEQHRDESWVDCSSDGSSSRRGRRRHRSGSGHPQPIRVKVGNFEGSFRSVLVALIGKL